MAASGFTPISLYYSATPSAAPAAGNLVAGELALNTADGKLYYKDSSNVVQVIATKASASGGVTGPASATDNAIARFDGTTGKIIQNSAVTIADTTGDITTSGYLITAAGTVSTPALTTTGDLNTGIYFPAADTIAFTEGGVEAMRIDSSGNVGIGTSSPTARFHVKGSNGEIHLQPDADTEYTALTFRNAANNSARGYVLYNYTSNFMSFRTNGSGEAMRIDSSGNVLVGKTTTTANGGDLQVSKGITFPATQSAQSDANTLDDYEEGTFTPTVAGTTTAGTGTYSVQIGRYVKIGKQVTVWVRLTWSAHTGTGKGVIANLPFTSQSISGGNHPFAATVGYEINYDTPANTVLSAYVEPNGTRIFFAQIGVGTQSGVADVDLDTAAGVSVSATYEVA